MGWNQERLEWYIQNCQKCQRNTQEIHKELLAKIERPQKIWKLVAIDHITKLPPVCGAATTGKHEQRSKPFQLWAGRPVQ